MSKVIYSSEINKYDNDGELTETQTKEVIKEKNEPEYIKMYINTVLSLSDSPKTLNGVLYHILTRLEYADKKNGSFMLINGYIKKQIAADLKVTVDTVNHCIIKLKKRNVIKRIQQSTYIVNPDYFSKGSWSDIKKIREVYVNFENKTITKKV